MKTEERKAFKAIVGELIREDNEISPFVPCNIENPNYLFLQALSILKMNVEINEEKEFWTLKEAFYETLRENNVRWVSSIVKIQKRGVYHRKKRMISDARKTDFRHHKVLGDDY